MDLTAAASTALGPELAAPARSAVALGGSDVAVYLGAGAHGVIAVLTSDALRLPCGLVLEFDARRRPLTAIAPLPGRTATVGDGRVQWTSRTGPVVIHAVRSWAPARVLPLGAAWAAGVAALERAIAGADFGVPRMLPTDVGQNVAEDAGEDFALELIGRGPGLTPSGDDVLAGLLLGARAFAVRLDRLAAAVDLHADARTTALSARLLRHAIDGECVPEVATLFAALPAGCAAGPAVDAVLRLGHTSGAALAHGIVVAARLAPS